MYTRQAHLNVFALQIYAYYSVHFILYKNGYVCQIVCKYQKQKRVSFS